MSTTNTAALSRARAASSSRRANSGALDSGGSGSDSPSLSRPPETGQQPAAEARLSAAGAGGHLPAEALDALKALDLDEDVDELEWTIGEDAEETSARESESGTVAVKTPGGGASPDGKRRFSLRRRRNSSKSSKEAEPELKIKLVCTIGDKQGDTPGKLDTPNSMCAVPSLGREPAPRLAIADTHNNRLQLVSSATGRNPSILGPKLIAPKGVCYSPLDGCVFVVEFGSNRVTKLRLADGEPLGNSADAAKEDGAKACRLKYPDGCALVGDLLFVADTEHHRLLALHAADLKVAFEVGSKETKGADPGHFHYPRGLATWQDNHVVVADSRNHRLQVLSRTGEHLKSIGRRLGQPESDELFPTEPVGVAAARDVLVAAEDEGKRIHCIGMPQGVPLQVLKLDVRPRGVCAYVCGEHGFRVAIAAWKDHKVKLLECQMEGFADEGKGKAAEEQAPQMVTHAL